MKNCLSLVAITLCFYTLCGGVYEEQISKADKLFKEKKYKEAAAVFDDASLETENDAKRIDARYRSWVCLRKVRGSNAFSTAESLLYDEAGLSSERKIELISYIAKRGNKQQREKVLEFALDQKVFSEKQRSRILLLAMNSGGTWQSEAYVNEVLAMKNPDPVAKANALGHRANVFLWVKRDPATALKYVNQALEIKELVGEDRQFYLLVQARCYVALKKFDQAERCYLSAIKIAKQRDFLEAAYKELIHVYVVSKQGMKIEPLLKRASEDKKMNKRQRLVFSNLLSEIEKKRNKK